MTIGDDPTTTSQLRIQLLERSCPHSKVIQVQNTQSVPNIILADHLNNASQVFVIEFLVIVLHVNGELLQISLGGKPLHQKRDI